MRRAALPLVLGLMGLGLLFTSVALAAPSQPAAIPLAAEGRFIYEPITSTDTTTHPVASAIADSFGVDYSKIADLHEQGYGFGVIAHAYFVAQKLKDLPQGQSISPESLLAMFNGGMGWGEIMKEYKLHPGQAGRGGNLGSIMSNRDDADQVDDTWMPPGQHKKNGEDGEKEPPGQLERTDDDDDDDDDRGGPPDTPPGQGKDKDKDKDKGKGKK